MGDEFLRGLGADIQGAFAKAGVGAAGFHQFQFEALLPTEKAARQVERELQRSGFTCRVVELPDDARWVCLASQPLEIDVPGLNGLGEKLVTIIERENGGEFNGWNLLASADQLSDPGAEVFQIGQFDVRNLDANRFRRVVVARVLDVVEPVERGPKYDDRISERLGAAQAGQLVAAGSHLNRNGDVVALRFEARLADTDSALQTFRTALIECGAPRGSTLRTEQREMALHERGSV